MSSDTFFERLALKALRSVSPTWRARTDLFHEPYRSETPWMSGLAEAGRVLHGIVRMTRPSVIVEIGSARGYSTCALALACDENRHGKVYAIDPHFPNEWTDLGTGGATYDFLTGRLREYHLEEYVEVIQQTSVDAAAGWNRTIDLLFIDGDHTLEGVTKDFESFAPWVSPEGLIAFHDSAWEHDRPWESYRNEAWFREDMGVGVLLDQLQKRGYQSTTLSPIPGITFMHPRPGGFDFVRRRPSAVSETTQRAAAKA